jgi:hypothetical protein
MSPTGCNQCTCQDSFSVVRYASTVARRGETGYACEHRKDLVSARTCRRSLVISECVSELCLTQCVFLHHFKLHPCTYDHCFMSKGYS